MVARLKPPFYGEGDFVAGHVIRLSKFYGHAMAAIEVNYSAVIMRDCKLAGIPMYKRSPWSHRVKAVVEQYGYKMGDKQERKELIDSFATAIRERGIEVLCPHAVAEYKSFVTLANGRSEAAAGSHDDDVTSSAMAWYTLPSAGEYKRQVAPEAQPPDRHTWKRVNVSARGW